MAGISIVEEGVFSRVVWTRHNLRNSIKWLSPTPNELPGAGIKVIEDKSIDRSKKDDYVDAYLNIYEKAVKDKNAFAILSIYTVSNWLFNDDLIREAGINYFSVVEAIASIYMPNAWNKSVYTLRDIHKVMELLNIDRSYRKIVDDAYNIRGELAHGHPKHLLLAQHVLSAQPVTSWSLKEPVLICKKAADIFFASFFNVSLQLSKSN